ncbi:hypothetical protein OQA88_1797 [Cercophora sp. LCS_1]
MSHPVDNSRQGGHEATMPSEPPPVLGYHRQMNLAEHSQEDSVWPALRFNNGVPGASSKQHSPATLSSRQDDVMERYSSPDYDAQRLWYELGGQPVRDPAGEEGLRQQNKLYRLAEFYRLRGSDVGIRLRKLPTPTAADPRDLRQGWQGDLNEMAQPPDALEVDGFACWKAGGPPCITLPSISKHGDSHDELN